MYVPATSAAVTGEPSENRASRSATSIVRSSICAMLDASSSRGTMFSVSTAVSPAATSLSTLLSQLLTPVRGSAVVTGVSIAITIVSSGVRRVRGTQLDPAVARIARIIGETVIAYGRARILVGRYGARRRRDLEYDRAGSTLARQLIGGPRGG